MEKLKVDLSLLGDDNLSGSKQITERAVGSVVDFCLRNRATEWQEQTGAVLNLFEELQRTHNQFATLIHFNNQLLSFAEETENQGGWDALLGFCMDYQQKWKDIDSALAGSVLRLLEPVPEEILVHSQSSTLISVFGYLYEQGLQPKIYQTESRPALEGRKQALTLSEFGFDVTLVVDTAVGAIMHNVNAAIIGADYISSEFLINKIGSYAIALLCRELKVPLYVIADSRKFGAPKILTAEIPKESDEVWEAAPSTLNFLNVYFERVPNNLVSGFVTEQGMHTPQSIRRMFSQGL